MEKQHSDWVSVEDYLMNRSQREGERYYAATLSEVQLMTFMYNPRRFGDNNSERR